MIRECTLCGTKSVCKQLSWMLQNDKKIRSAFTLDSEFHFIKIQLFGNPICGLCQEAIRSHYWSYGISVRFSKYTKAQTASA
jgi:hypothetical protein